MTTVEILHVFLLSLLLALFSLDVQSLPIADDATIAPRPPCAQVSHLVSQTNSTTIPAELAYDCLNSVPLHVAEAKRLHRSLIPYLKWHTTFSYVREPPVGYQMPSFDFWPAFNNLDMKLTNEAYSNEWEFGMDLLQTFNNGHDGHLRYILDVVGKVFSFGRKVTLVSVSLDGQSLPQVYVHGTAFFWSTRTLADIGSDDIQQWLHHNKSLPAAILAINRQAVNRSLDKWMRVGWHQDPDALYNALFWSAPLNTLDQGMGGPANGLFGGSGQAQFFYPGPNTELLFANGTRITYPNFARVKVDLTGIKDGESFYQRFCGGEEPSTASTTILHTTSTTLASTSCETTVIRTATPGYPPAVVRHPGNLIAGYYLGSPAYDKVAVLGISNFVSGDEVFDQTNFQRSSQEFIRKAKAAGKTKLILDMRGNPGGTILHAFDLFKQLFPHLEPWGASRFRAFDTVNAIGEQISWLLNAKSNITDMMDIDLSAVNLEPFDYQVDMDFQSHNFTSWSNLYGPVAVPDRDNFTRLIRFNLSSPILVEGLGINMTGYQPRASTIDRHDMDPPFKADDMIMLHDGFCSSTCATFTDLLRVQAGIKSVVMGGRPQYRPMQAVGGTRGMEVYSLDYIHTLTKVTWRTGGAEQQAEWNRTAPDLGSISEEPMRRWARDGWGTVNVRDSILKANEVDGVPSQFLWVPADCRLWYTPQMVQDVTAVWRMVSDVAWGPGNKGTGKQGTGGNNGKPRCVVGSL